MSYQIQRMSAKASELLKKSSAGFVHSVYRKTVNLNIGGELLALQAENSPLSPISLITELTKAEMDALPLTEGLPVQTAKDFIRIGSHTLAGSVRPPEYLFCHKSAEIIPVVFQTFISSREKELLLNRMESVIAASHTGGFDCIFQMYQKKTGALPSLILESACQHITNAWNSFCSSDYETAVSSLSGLIGLGTGLTPSGDDFLCGIFAGFSLCGMSGIPFAVLLRKEIQTKLRNTNDISRAFLSCALQGQFSLPVISLARIPEAGNIRDSFGEIGHSSGFDTLCGICFAMKLLTVAMP